MVTLLRNAEGQEVDLWTTKTSKFELLQNHKFDGQATEGSIFARLKVRVDFCVTKSLESFKNISSIVKLRRIPSGRGSIFGRPKLASLDSFKNIHSIVKLRRTAQWQRVDLWATQTCKFRLL